MPWTYGAFNKERGIAPGLPSYQELKQVYQYPAINSETMVFGVLGDPVAHSLSPLIHNSAFGRMGLNMRLPPLPGAATESADVPGGVRVASRSTATA